ncbi:hypothetical protein [Roseomonas sp. CECT 9278]|uniref:hypothetical protein n=1 Tax=Roseomonas sp. CECT 9278 TaxID=2845823 RepID=UPI001E462D94|nr:hypothetical protein [Roseomonas sp. CECT 9278]
MSQVPLWVSYLQALATPAIALLAAAIAWGQWQTSRQKFVQDLFDRRMDAFAQLQIIVHKATFEDHLEALALVVQNGAKIRFLFGDDLFEECKILTDYIARMNGIVKSDEQPPKEVDLQNLRDRLQKQFTAMVPMFEPYMRMDQMLPGRLRLL